MTIQANMPEEGMTCTGWENDIRSALPTLKAVQQADPDHRAKPVQVDYDSGLITLAGLRRVIEADRYRVVGS